MKAISLWQPWASLWLTPAKLHETRHWPTRHRGSLYVHAAKKLVSECGEELDEICIQQFGAMWRRTLPRGSVIGIVNLVDCIATEHFTPCGNDAICGDFAPGRYGWRRADYACAIGPWPVRGRQGMWDIPEVEIEAIANRTLGLADREA